jgi:hypothetical protein
MVQPCRLTPAELRPAVNENVIARSASDVAISMQQRFRTGVAASLALLAMTIQPSADLFL